MSLFFFLFHDRFRIAGWNIDVLLSNITYFFVDIMHAPRPGKYLPWKGRSHRSSLRHVNHERDDGPACLTPARLSTPAVQSPHIDTGIRLCQTNPHKGAARQTTGLSEHGWYTIISRYIRKYLLSV